jgi:hypothetical protein
VPAPAVEHGAAGLEGDASAHGCDGCCVATLCPGRNHFIGGKLVPSSIDAYLVMEFADGGDLFGLRGQLAATEVEFQALCAFSRLLRRVYSVCALL